MKKLIFRQKTRFGRTNLCVEEKTLELISETAKGHQWAGRIIPLVELSSHYERQRVLRYRHIAFWLGVALAIVWITRLAWFSTDATIPRILFMAPAVSAIYCFIRAAQESVPTELLLFSNKHNQVLFGLVREKKHAQEFDAFVSQLKSRIANAAHASRD